MSLKCSPRHDAVISPQEFRAIQANIAAPQKSSQRGSLATATLSKRQNYSKMAPVTKVFGS